MIAYTFGMRPVNGHVEMEKVNIWRVVLSTREKEGFVVSKHALNRNGSSSWPRVPVDTGMLSLSQNSLGTCQSVACLTKKHVRTRIRRISGRVNRAAPVQWECGAPLPRVDVLSVQLMGLGLD